MILKIYNPYPKNHIFFIECLKKFYINKQIKEIKEIKKVENDLREDECLYFIIVNHMYIIENYEIQNDINKICQKNNKILYITEPLELIIEKQYYQKLIHKLKPKKIYTYCEENKNKIKTLMPIEYFYPINKNYLRLENSIKEEKDTTKIVFIGKMNDYRNQLYDIFGDDLIIYEDKYLKEEWKEIINKYYYFVNVHRRPNSKCFESFRLIPLLQNDVVILSEHVNTIEEEKYKKKIQFCELNEMKNLFNHLKNKY